MYKLLEHWKDDELISISQFKQSQRADTDARTRIHTLPHLMLTRSDRCMNTHSNSPLHVQHIHMYTLAYEWSRARMYTIHIRTHSHTLSQVLRFTIHMQTHAYTYTFTQKCTHSNTHTQREPETREFQLLAVEEGWEPTHPFLDSSPGPSSRPQKHEG